jgi:uncharacterized protein YkwD
MGDHLRRRIAGGGIALLALILLLPSVVSADPGAISGGSLPEPGGTGLVVWGGGSTSELASVVETSCAPRSAWANRSGGGLVGFIFGAPSAVNSAFLSHYPGGSLPAETPLVVVCADSGQAATSAAPAPQTPQPEIRVATTVGAEIDTVAEAAMLALVNEARASAGLKPLVLDQALVEVARAHSSDMWSRGFFSHTNPDGLSPFDRMSSAGISFGWAGENLAIAPTTAIAHQNLMDSPGHRENLLSPNFGRIGIGVAHHTDLGLIFTQAFTD